MPDCCTVITAVAKCSPGKGKKDWVRHIFFSFFHAFRLLPNRTWVQMPTSKSKGYNVLDKEEASARAGRAEEDTGGKNPPPEKTKNQKKKAEKKGASQAPQDHHFLLSMGPRPKLQGSPARRATPSFIFTSLHIRSEAEASPPGELTLTTTPSIWDVR